MKNIEDSRDTNEIIKLDNNNENNMDNLSKFSKDNNNVSDDKNIMDIECGY